MTQRVRATWLACALLLWVRSSAFAQSLPSEPIVIADGLVTLGGDVSASFGSQDSAFFNYTDYEHSALRLLRADLTASLKAGAHMTILGEVQALNTEPPQAYALYLRIHPWTARAFDIQVGRIPPTFGAFGRRTYAADNPLIGYPLAYQYLTSLRPDALPANANDLLKMRGRGWLSSYPIGNLEPDRGLPLASAFRWDTGAQIHAATKAIEGSVAVTTGTISNPLFVDDNSGRQIAGRLVVRPMTGLVLGTSASRGPFLTSSVVRAAGSSDGSRFTQAAWGADAEYSRQYYLIRAEAIWSRWRVPAVSAPLIDRPLDATAISVEGRYKLAPGFYVAARGDHLGFSRVTGTTGSEPWDAPVRRIEIGAGYSLQRNLIVKVAVQDNVRDLPHPTRSTLSAVQLVYWF
jgi:hypothetical protein